MVLLKEEYLPKAKVKSKRSDLLIVPPRAWPSLQLKCKLVTCRNQSWNVTWKQSVIKNIIIDTLSGWGKHDPPKYRLIFNL